MRAVEARGGGAAVEFGFMLPLLIVLVYGIIELSRMLWGMAVLNFAVEQAARYAVISCSSSCSPGVRHYAANNAALAIGIAPDYTQFTVTPGAACGSGVSGTLVAVQVTFTIPVLQLLQGGAPLSVPLYAQSCYPT